MIIISDEQKLYIKKSMLKAWTTILKERGIISDDKYRHMIKDFDKIIS